MSLPSTGWRSVIHFVCKPQTGEMPVPLFGFHDSREVSSYGRWHVMTFEERLKELLVFYTLIGKREEDYLHDADIRHFHRWRMKSLWLLVQHLGENHLFTGAFRDNVTEPSYSHVRAGKGILEALEEEYARGHLKISEP